MWERQINSAVDTQNKQITGKPVTSAKEFRSINNQAMKDIGDVSTKIKLSLNNVEAINKAPNLLTKIEQPTILTDPSKQVFLEGKHFTLMANKVEVTKNDLGQKVYNFNKTSAPNAEVVAIQYANQGIDHVTANTMS
jgi:hypothetical protein